VPAHTANSNDLDRADMLRLAAGHDAALNELMERHGSKIFNYLLRSLQSEDDAADLTEETFVRVYQNRANFDPSLTFSTWLYAIASNLVRTKFRYRARHPQLSLDAEIEATGANLREALPEDTPDPSQSLLIAESADAVRKAIATLPEDLRTPLILSEYEDLSHAEIAAILDCSSKAIEARLYRARKQLRSVLAKLLR
jgi:RNA polymerase sigma-70 factor (ECF subfamily)